MKYYIKQFEQLTTHELYEIIHLRIEVFSVEQNCIYQDLDNKDQDALHVFIKENNEIVAYLRVLNNSNNFVESTIGRVISKYRGKKLGSNLISYATNYLEEKYKTTSIILHAQVNALDFYLKNGFEVISEVFLIDDIDHVTMKKVSL